MHDPSPDRIAAWLRETMDSAERDAAAAPEETWRVVDTRFGPEIHVGDDAKWSREGQGVEAAYRCDDPHDDCDDARASYLAETRMIHRNAQPSAVLSRIAADRKTLAECENVIAMDPNGWEYTDTPELAEAVIRNLAASWGWTGGEQP